jgi:hypothetical protein
MLITRSGHSCSTRSVATRVRSLRPLALTAELGQPIDYLFIFSEVCTISLPRSDIRTEEWGDHAADGSKRRTRSFQSPFETALLDGVAKVREEQAMKSADDGSRLVLAASVSMEGDVPYCDCYHVHTLLDVSLLVDAERAQGLLVRVFMGAEFVK